MGFNTVAVILNDTVDQAKRDPHFGQKVFDAVLAWGSRRNRWEVDAGCLHIVSQTHADYPQVVVARYNTAWSSTSGEKPTDTDLWAMAGILEDNGFKVSRRRPKATPSALIEEKEG